MILLNNILKKYKKSIALDIINLQINEGEIIGLLGNNGAGKTTLLRAILDLLNLEKGTVQIDDLVTRNSEIWKNNVSSYLDEGFLIPYLKPFEYFAFIAKAYQLSKSALDIQLDILKVFLGEEILRNDKYIKNYSKGNIQKIGIASAFIPIVKYIFLDEPFANLDPTSQKIIKDLILTCNRKNGTCFIISSHDLAHTRDISTRIVLLHKGSVKIDEQSTSQAFRDVEKYFFNGSK